MLQIDLHIHSINSYHAYGTFYDIVKEAKAKKMKMIAITDHGLGDPNHFGRHHFTMGRRSPKIKGLKVLWGCESNPINENGDLDINEEDAKKLDVLLMGVHADQTKNLGYEKNTELVLKALDNPKIKIYTHPYGARGLSLDWEKTVQKALEKNILLEINLSQLVPTKYDPTLLERIKKMVQMAKAAGKKVIVNSDAHFIHEIGDDSNLKKYAKEIGLTKEMIINNYPKELEKILELKK